MTNKKNTNQYDEYPIFRICNLNANKTFNDLFNIDRLSKYVDKNPGLEKVHKHHFYHLVLFTSGQGEHILDFNSHPIKKRIIYFMRPNQVHKWIFDGEVEGYVVNFSSTFLDQMDVRSSILENFPFFNVLAENQVIELDKSSFVQSSIIFEKILLEIKNSTNDIQTMIMVTSYLMQILVVTSRNIKEEESIYNQNNMNSYIINKFLKLIEKNYKEVRFPKDYAALLFITSNHLNFVCQEELKTSAGDLIQKRVILESKRLLTNFELSVSAIAVELNFFDTSYFVKFFKKHTGITPVNFRKKYYNKSNK